MSAQATLTRRNALTVVGATALATVALPAIAETHPDAELLALGETFLELEQIACDLGGHLSEVRVTVRRE